MDGRSDRPQVHVPCDAQRNGVRHNAIGLIPIYESIGLTAAFLLFGLRMIQGLCLGGEYGGAITYVAEHVPDESRGYYTGWLQTSPTLGIVVSLAVIIATRTYFGNEAFNAWAWRVPLLVSFLLVAIAIYICPKPSNYKNRCPDHG